jgi:hypothetical protein
MNCNYGTFYMYILEPPLIIPRRPVRAASMRIIFVTNCLFLSPEIQAISRILAKGASVEKP